MYRIQERSDSSQPYMDGAGTSRTERHNLFVRMEIEGFTRLTNAFSEKWANHHAALPHYQRIQHYRLSLVSEWVDERTSGLLKSVL